MFELKKVPLPTYSRLEDSVNSVTHALGAILTVPAAVLSFKKLGPNAEPVHIFAVCVYLVTVFILYLGSAVYHALRPSFAKQVARVIDHSNVFLMITGSLTAFYLLSVINVNRGLAIAFCIAAWIATAIGILFTFMDQEKFKKLQIVMYLLIGWTAVSGIFSVYKTGESGRLFTLYALFGGILETIGTVFYVVGKKHKYIHAVFHVFVLAGSGLQFLGLYKFML